MKLMVYLGYDAINIFVYQLVVFILQDVYNVAARLDELKCLFAVRRA
jgi:hypothetical protein